MRVADVTASHMLRPQPFHDRDVEISALPGTLSEQDVKRKLLQITTKPWIRGGREPVLGLMERLPG